MADWYDYQEKFIREFDLSACTGAPIFEDTANLLEVIVFKRKQTLKKDAQIAIYADRLEMVDEQGRMTLDYGDVKAMVCIAGHKLNIFYKDKIYQLRGGKSFNALKYCNIYYHAKFMEEEHKDGEFQFLGL